MRILVVEDEIKIATFIEKGLKNLGHAVDLAATGNLAKEKAAMAPYDVIILDAMLPDMDGISLIKTFKLKDPKPSVLMLTALNATKDKVNGLDAGADDYMTKPFEFDELCARIKAIGRRFSVERKELKVADLVLNLNTRAVKRAEQKINLTTKEFTLLEYLMSNKGIPLTRVQIAEHVWDLHFDSESNVVDVYINHLRKKIDSEFPQKLIRTLIGHGYVLTDED
jgi:two-component system copper resistance phosphate regulon response regulator CusR